MIGEMHALQPVDQDCRPALGQTARRQLRRCGDRQAETGLPGFGDDFEPGETGAA